MHRKLVGYFLLSFLSFCFFTGVFHAIAHAQAPLTPAINPQLADTTPQPPTPTIYETSTAQPQQVTVTPTQISLPTPTIYNNPQVLAASTKATDTETTPVTPEPTTAPIVTPTIPSPTPTPLPQPTIAVATDLESLFSEYSNTYHVSEDLLKHIARCESGFNPTSNNSGMYLGMFQFSAGTWSSNRNRMGLDPNADLRTDPEEAIRTAAYVISVSGTGAWPVCGK
ncbi:MAG: transglycosylase SLT domain-containing protein [Candidatus Levyibacteriota bacterium]